MDMLGVLIVLIIFAMLGYALYDAYCGISYKKYRREQEQKNEEEEKRIERRMQQEKLYQEELEKKRVEEERLAEEYNTFKEEAGEPDKEISIRKDWKEKDSFLSRLIIFDSHEVVYLRGKKYAYKDILGCSLNDDQTTNTTSYSEGNSRANNGSVIGRAVVGGVLGGGVGALAGAATSKRNMENVTTYNTSTDHDYTITIQINDIKNPIIQIKLKNQSQKVQEIMAVFAIILHKNNNEPK